MKPVVPICVLVMLVIIGTSPHYATAQTSRHCFVETGLCIKGRIREYWEQNGGLSVFGLPITPQQQAVVEGQTIQMQWFERNRIELHPENTPPYDVLLGRLGADRIEQQNRAQNQPLHKVNPSPQDPENCRFFAETGHNVCGDILAAWRAHGLDIDGNPGTSEAESLALFGLPLSEAHTETLVDDKAYTVQWFERARLELHPEYDPPYHVQLGLLGSELHPANAGDSYPRFESSACPFSVPQGMDIECGYLSVPEDRSQPDSPTIQLAVAIVPTQSANPAADPVVYLSGGPGSAALMDTVSFARGWASCLADRDFIVLDQRGTGFSRPSLTCTESEQLAEDLPGQDISRAEKVQAEMDAALRCRDRLARDGVHLAGYTSAANATDLNDLRIALGYNEWNLFGISYGTRLALTAMRDYPEGVRSVILDSTYPLQVNLFTDMPANINRSLTRLFDNCAANPTCNQASPDLEAVFYNLVAQLNTNPVTIWPRNPTTGKAVKIRVDGAELINLVFHLLYDTQSIPSLPKMIYSAWNGDYSLLTTMQQRRLARASRRFSHGMYFSVECSEEIAFATPQEIKTSIATYPRLETFFAGIPENTSEIFTFCDTWGIHTPDPVENQPVRSDIPTLILAGEYDPITPPHWGRLAAETLDRSYVYEFSGTGHAVITRGACPQTLIRTFLDDPSHAPDSSCVQ